MPDWDDDTPAEERDRLLDIAARVVVSRGLDVPAVLFLEMHKPLTFIASQSLVFFAPFVAPFMGMERVERVSRLMAKRENVDLLIARIEDLAEERRRSKEPDHAARER